MSNLSVQKCEEEVRSYLYNSLCSYEDLLESKRMDEDLTKMVQIEHDLIQNILSYKNLFQNAVNYEILSGIMEACDFVSKKSKSLMKEEYLSLPFGMFDNLSITRTELIGMYFDSKELRKKLCGDFGIEYISDDEVQENYMSGDNCYRYRSGISFDKEGHIRYDLIMHPYLVDSSLIYEENYAPKRVKVSGYVKRF